MAHSVSMGTDKALVLSLTRTDHHVCPRLPRSHTAHVSLPVWLSHSPSVQCWLADIWLWLPLPDDWLWWWAQVYWWPPHSPHLTCTLLRCGLQASTTLSPGCCPHPPHWQYPHNQSQRGQKFFWIFWKNLNIFMKNYAFYNNKECCSSAIVSHFFHDRLT